jgi:hypothetical protein
VTVTRQIKPLRDVAHDKAQACLNFSSRYMNLSIPWLDVVTPCTRIGARRRRGATAGPNLSRAAVLLACAGTVGGCSPALDWREVAPGDAAGLVALLPCRPARDVRRVPLGAAPVSMTLHACPQAGATWAVAHADTGDPAAVGPALQAMQAAARANIGAAPAVGLPLQIPGMTPSTEARQLTLSGRLPDGTPVRQHVWLFARGTVVAQASVIGADPPADGVAVFAEGLRFRP